MRLRFPPKDIQKLSGLYLAELGARDTRLTTKITAQHGAAPGVLPARDGKCDSPSSAGRSTDRSSRHGPQETHRHPGLRFLPPRGRPACR